MFKFAHLADCHLGAFRDQVLRELNLKAFLSALDKCIAEGVDFILIAGDMLDNNLPDSRILNSAVKKLKEVHDKGIAVYVIYGSHDYSPNKTSMIDILHSAGLFRKVGGDDIENPELNFITDKKTGAKILGMSAKRLGLEAKQVNLMDFSRVESESGFKIFMFHSAVAECNDQSASISGALSASRLPKGFSYYASGHVHSKFFGEKCSRLIGFPGPTFGSDYRDLESASGGISHGFFIVEFDSSSVKSHKFVEAESPEVIFKEYDASGKSAAKAETEIESFASSIDAKNKIILLRIFGELATGKPGDMNFSKIKDIISQKGAVSVYINRNALESKEQAEVKVSGESREEIENNVFGSCLENFSSDNSEIMEKSHQMSLDLLRLLKEEQKGGTKSDYEKKVVESSMKLLGV